MKINKILIIFLALVLLPWKLAMATPYPLDYFAVRAVIKNVEISPDGKNLALIKTLGKEGKPILEVYNASDLRKKPFRVNAKPMEIIGVNWVSNDNIILTLRQKTRDNIKGFNRGVFDYRIAKLDIKKKKLTKFHLINPRVVNVLPDKPNKILLAFLPKDGGKTKSTSFFRPFSYYEFDLKTGRKKLILKGSPAFGDVRFNAKGQPIFARGFDLSRGEYTWLVRAPGTSDWVEVFRLSENSFETFRIVDFDSKPDTLLVTANNGKNTVGLWEYNYKKKQFAEPVYQRKDVDVVGARYHSNSWKYPDTVVGVAYRTDKTHIEYFDPQEKAILQQLEQITPNAFDLRISSRAKDEPTMVIRNIGPRDPGTFYLLKNGHFKIIGSTEPLLKGKALADVKYVSYKSRDGKDIHAYITIPNGKGPFPTIVLPHGGPFVQEVVEYDEWGQMLANNGYLVIQPEYRGSKGYGLDFYKSAFIPKGQGGYKMQDDLDDAIPYLVKHGYTDPARVAMFGWSYGGYAALVAASRTPQSYQCVIAGAAVSDTIMQLNYYKTRMRGAPRVEQVNMWKDSISPIKEVAKVNVPILLIHGSVDQRVPLKHSKIYREQLDKFHKPYKFVLLEGADHFSNTLFYDHKIKLYNSIINFLHDDCGPGGL